VSRKRTTLRMPAGLTAPTESKRQKPCQAGQPGTECSSPMQRKDPPAHVGTPHAPAAPILTRNGAPRQGGSPVLPANSRSATTLGCAPRITPANPPSVATSRPSAGTPGRDTRAIGHRLGAATGRLVMRPVRPPRPGRNAAQPGRLKNTSTPAFFPASAACGKHFGQRESGPRCRTCSVPHVSHFATG